MSSLEPPPRNSFFSAASNSCFYVWGGDSVAADDLQYLYVFKSETGAWNKSLLTGPHPPGVWEGASAMVDQCLYVYGGLSRTGNRTGSLFELNTASLSWSEASPPVAGGPRKKSSCGMVNCGATLIIFGGETTLVHYTNELHVYDTVTGTWSSPRFTGQSPPPCSCFTFTKVSHHQVMLHGGVGNDGTYMLDLSTMHWTKFPSYLSGTSGLHGHAAVCLGLNSDCAQLLVFGGLFTDYVWLLDVATKSWTKLSVNNKHLIRLYHGAAAIQSTIKSEEVIIFGGLKNASVSTAVAKTTLLRFRKKLSAPHDVLWWHLTDIMPVTQLGMKEKHISTHNMATDFIISKYTEIKSLSLLYKGNDINIVWKGCGLQLYVDKEDLLTNKEYEIKISVVAPTELTIPEEYEVVSGLYLIDCSYEFNKPVTIRIQHCVTESFLENLVFATSVDQTSPHKLHCIEGKFDYNFGELQVTSFSPFIILRRLFSWFPRSRGTSYSAYLYHSDIYKQELQSYWDLNFFIVKKLEVYESLVESHAQNMYLSGRCIVEFSATTSEISFEPRDIASQDFLQACPITSQKLSKRVIDRYTEGYPPGCGLQLVSFKPTVRRIEILFDMIGLREPQNFIRFIWPTSKQTPVMCLPQSTSLTMNDLSIAYDATYDARVKWYEIGLVLGISPDTLEAIQDSRSDSDKCLRNTLKHWLQNSTNRSWTALATAMGNRAVGRLDIKEIILREHV